MRHGGILLSVVSIALAFIATAPAQPPPQQPQQQQQQQQTAAIEPVTPKDLFTHSPQLPKPLADDDAELEDQFSWGLLRDLLKEEQRNVVISPISLKIVLAMLYEAAGNNTQTQKELSTVLVETRSPEAPKTYFKGLLGLLNQSGTRANQTLILGTRIYTDEFIEPQQRYAAILNNFYETDIERLNFADPRAAAEVINAWCHNVTNGQLNGIVREDQIQNDVLLMLNAIYFNGQWLRPFNTSFVGSFLQGVGPAAKQLKADFMEQTGHFDFYNSQALNAKLLRLPYTAQGISMFLLLPNAESGFDEMVEKLQPGQIKRMQSMLYEMKVRVTLPKFKFEFSKSLMAPLNRLGVSEIFTLNASLPGLARGAEVARKLRVSNIFQKAGIDVNERGTEAFASTIVEIENKFGGSTLQEFNANRPFVFFIEEEVTGTVIFSGKVVEPLQPIEKSANVM